jgi:phosphinothricin acetyltransferase
METLGLLDRSAVSVRYAEPRDAAEIARIYNQGIEDRLSTLETQLRSPEERGEWLVAHGERHPVFVAADQSGHIVGWSCLNRFNPRAVYDNVADLSVFVAREARRRGVGTVLMEKLESRAREIGYHKLVLAAFATNRPALALYERQGFSYVGVYHEQGVLDGRWMDVALMEKILV